MGWYYLSAIALEENVWAYLCGKRSQLYGYSCGSMSALEENDD